MSHASWQSRETSAFSLSELSSFRFEQDCRRLYLVSFALAADYLASLMTLERGELCNTSFD
jgi:hypothetical protein